MEIRCKVLKMKSRVAPECALELSEAGWLASQWDHVLLSEGSVGFA